MKKEIQDLINQLMIDNQKRSEDMRNPNISEYGHTVKVHEYNTTLDIIKKLETILKKY